MPLYGCYWGMACVSDRLDPLAVPAETIDERIRTRGIGALRYYNGAVHRPSSRCRTSIASCCRGKAPHLLNGTRPPRAAKNGAGPASWPVPPHA